MVKDNVKKCKCPYCDKFEGMYSTKDCCEHARKCHIREVMDWLQNGPKGKPRLSAKSEQRLREQGVDPICWAAGMIMCTQ